ncbi:acyclic terpene utilization AtuA family protein [Streptomyces sp. NPDC091292]|uniref:acyclic terpene utilization AtuA family protein n=1 Tax=Streptomyces sp. NPDC091292 TaxID=3365991 RepID=UPI0037F2BD58
MPHEAQAVTAGPRRRPVRIANCSGFYGDTLSAARDMVEGGPIDVLTGDYLAELTMFLLHKARQRTGRGYATTFLTQLEQVLGTCLERGIRVVANAGGLAPSLLAEEIGHLSSRLGLAPRIAYVAGDDLTPHLERLRKGGEDFAHLDDGRPLSVRTEPPVTANAYLGGWGITQALAAGADIVVTGRVTDAALVSGPAAWWHGWSRTDWDRLAGAVIAGHVIECGPQVCGGNYPFLEEIRDRRYPGFPLAEVDDDGSSVITKHPGTGGLVSPGTVTAQLLYEIGSPAYEGPDVIAHFDSVSLRSVGGDRVRISGAQGSPPGERLKVAMNFSEGFRNTMIFVITGLGIEAKADLAREQFLELLDGPAGFDDLDFRLLRFDHEDADDNTEAVAHLRITVKGPDERRVGKAFSALTTAMAVGSYAGLHTTTPPTPATAFGSYWPALVRREAVEHVVVLPDGRRCVVEHSPSGEPRTLRHETPSAPAPTGPTRRVPLGLIAGARSGDKGGNANIGVWTRDDAAYTWLRDWLTTERLRDLLPEARDLVVRRHALPRLRALNFVVVGLLGEGVASTTRPDPQAKGLGEYLRSRYVEVPACLLAAEGL